MSIIWRVAVPVPLYTLFDYLPIPESPTPKPGCRVRVPFGRHSRIGCLLDIAKASDVDPARLKTAIAILDDAPLLAARDLALLQWAARYYHHPLGEVLAAAFPGPLRKGRLAPADPPGYLALTEEGILLRMDTLSRAPRQALLIETLRAGAQHSMPTSALDTLLPHWRRTAAVLIERGLAGFSGAPAALPESSPPVPPAHPGLRLNAAQLEAIDVVSAGFDQPATFLLEGVTGSGKTEVYLDLVRRALARGTQTLLLLPEISLTPQIEERFRTALGRDIGVFHSRLTEAARLQSWLSSQRGAIPVLLGTRSAVFVPMQRPGLIIVDEEHDASYKQQDGFRLSARDVAIKRAHDLGIPILLGSATPSLESLWNAERGRYRWLRLPERAGGASAPEFALIDIRRQHMAGGLSRKLIDAMHAVLGLRQQVLLFINRRGYAPTLICDACGWVAECPRCDARLVTHRHDDRVRCHHCGHEQAIPKACPACRSRELRTLGLGTERIEQTLAELFPAARVLRIDRDTTARAGSLERKLADVHGDEVDILIGTQMLAKGHHFPRVTLVGIVDADAMLFATDFRAAERTAQLIVQVAGRAGRADQAGRVLLQTRNPEHPLLQTLIEHGYPGFAAAALAERRSAHLPPFGHLAVWRADAVDADAPREVLTDLRELAERCDPGRIDILGPAPAPMLRQAGRHRYQLLLQSAERAPLHALIDRLQPQLPELLRSRSVRCSLDIDPIDCY